MLDHKFRFLNFPLGLMMIFLFPVFSTAGEEEMSPRAENVLD